MAFNILVSDNADNDIQLAYLYYLNTKKSPQSANNFYDELLNDFNAITLNPFYKIYHKNYRGFPMKKFPYIIFLEIDNALNNVNILSVFNTYQSTDKYPL